MIPMTPALSQLVASRRRQATEAEYSFLSTRQQNIRAALSLASPSLFGLIDEHAMVAADVPSVPMTTQLKTAISKRYYPDEPEVFCLLAFAQRLSLTRMGNQPATPARALPASSAAAPATAGGPGDTTGPGGPGGPGGPPATPPGGPLGVVPPDRLENWSPLIELSARLREEGQVGVNLTLDLTLELDAFSWFNLRTLMQELVQTLEDPQTPPETVSELLDGFKDFLRYKEVLLSTAADNKEQIGQAGQQAAAQVAAAHKDEVLMEVQYATDRGQTVPQDLLEQAAVWWQQRQSQFPGAPLTPTSGAAGAPSPGSATGPAAGKSSGRKSKR